MADSTWTTQPIKGVFDSTVNLPGSKSLTNRALVLAALASGPCVLENVLFADDTRHMLENLQKLGLSIDIDEANRRVSIAPKASPDFATKGAELFCGNSGTTLRFLAGLLAAVGEGSFTLKGNDRMHQRPIGPLVTLLSLLAGENGTKVATPEREGFPPLRIDAKGLSGGQIRYPSGKTLSSQYLSAALMVAPYTTRETHVELEGPQTSWPYVQMTMRLMDLFGVTPELERHEETGAPEAICIPRGRYEATTYPIEPDASAASYFLALAAIHPGSRVTVKGLGTESLQGDAAFADVLRQMGCEVTQTDDTTTVTGPDQLDGVDVDLTDMPDCAQTLAVTALFAVGETTIRGIHTLRVKETDRVAALEAELTKLGAIVNVVGDAGGGRDGAVTIVPPVRVRPASIATYDDHRMAMSFSLAATKRAGIEIEDSGCVSKTFPEYWEVLEGVLGRL